MHLWKGHVGGMTALGSLYLCHSPSNPSPSAPGEGQYSSQPLVSLQLSLLYLFLDISLYFGYAEDKTAEGPVKVLQIDL